LRILFFGTAPFAAYLLRRLLEARVDIVGVVTRPDRPRGRGQRSGPSPVKAALLEVAPHIPLFQPEKASTPEFAQEVRALHPDLFLVVAYGEIIKKLLLELPPRGAVNVHASLLPRYRGAAPMERALMDGCTESGITIIEMVEAMDAGDMLGAVRCPISPDETRGELEEKLQGLSFPLLMEVLAGKGGRVSQQADQVTFAPKIRPEDEKISWERSAEAIHNQVRALSPAPGAWCLATLGGVQKRLKLLRTRLKKGLQGKPGERLPVEGLVIACGKDALEICELQVEGKKPLASLEFLRGLHGSNNFLEICFF
jgi:methionyl-tRNA formyltransferase